MRHPSLTIGIEEEYQIVDPETGRLHSYVTQDFREDHRVIREFEFEPRLGHSVIEVGTSVCRSASEAAEELIKIRKSVSQLAADNNLAIIAAGTNPVLTREPEGDPFMPISNIGIKQKRLALEKRRRTFSTHIHITIEDREFLIDAMNVSRYLMPHVLCLSTSSPFWMGQESGLKSYRSLYMRRFARTGIPRVFGSWAEYIDFVDILVNTNSIDDGSSIWWDVRPNWSYPTLEFRICDVCTRIEEAACIAAIFQAIIGKLWKLRYDNMSFRVYPADMIEENKWRAARYGLEGKLIDFGKRREMPAKELIHELIDWFISDVVDDLGSRKEVNYAYNIMDSGTSADRQLVLWRQTHDLKAVAKMLIKETNDLPTS